jgi:uncharacterized membrane protein YsdA (DUF1294 family)
MSREPSAVASAALSVGVIFATSFCALMAWGVLVGSILIPTLAYYVVASVVTVCIYAIDKSAARRNRRRIPENTLHLFAVVGGWPGALFAQQTLRHKSSKGGFQLVFWMTVVLSLTCFLKRSVKRLVHNNPRNMGAEANDNNKTGTPE